MKATRSTTIAGAVALAALSGPALAAEMGAVDEPIKLAINEWTGQHLSTRVAGAILERAGYSVEYVTAGYGPQFIALGEGDLHAISPFSTASRCQRSDSVSRLPMTWALSPVTSISAGRGRLL